MTIAQCAVRGVLSCMPDLDPYSMACAMAPSSSLIPSTMALQLLHLAFRRAALC